MRRAPDHVLQELPRDAQDLGRAVLAAPRATEGLGDHRAADDALDLAHRRMADGSAEMRDEVRRVSERVVQRALDDSEVERLREERSHTALGETKGLIGVGLTADRDDGRQGGERVGGIEHVERITVGERDVEHDQVGSKDGQRRERLDDGAARRHGRDTDGERPGEQPAQRGVVFDDEKSVHGSSSLPDEERGTNRRAPPSPIEMTSSRVEGRQLGPGSEPESDRESDPVTLSVDQSAFRWEAVISGVRAAFCAMILVRLVATGVLGAGGSARVLIETPVLLALLGFSLWIIARARSGRATTNLLLLSVAVDAIGCFVALLTNVLLPWPSYDGILRIPDAAALLVVTTASGFRLSPSAARLGCILHALSTSILIALDLSQNSARVAYGARDIVLFAILVLGAMSLATVISTRVRHLVRLGAMQQVRAERARLNLWHVLEGNHEMRSALSAVALETDLFLRAARSYGSPGERGDREGVSQDELVRVGCDLRAELARLNALVVGMRERSYAELAAMHAAARVNVREIADEVVARAHARFPGVLVTVLGDAEASVVMAGGRTSLDRVLTNLVMNACEGDGRAGAKHVEIDVRRRPNKHEEQEERVTIVVRDDGPGIPAQVLASPVDARGPTTKAEGSGLGFFLVHTIVAATGGSLTRATRSIGGAEVIVDLPGAHG